MVNVLAFCIPESIRSTATKGERILFNTLKMYLPDDYIVYYEPEIEGRRPDFVIIGPDLGLVVLEVKDYTKSSLYQINKEEWILRSSTGELCATKCPLKQARDYTFHIASVLKKDNNLIHTDGKYAFHLRFPYGYGVVFTRLTARDMVENGMYRVLPLNQVFTRDEIDPESETFSEENLMEKLLNMFVVPYRLRDPLSFEDMKAIRFHLFPEVRISAEVKEPVPYQDQLLLTLHDIQVMDLHQENLAKQIGDKHRLIRGVAGSGKTLILVSRAKLLAREHPDWKILIMCYNISLSQYIKFMVHHQVQQNLTLFDFDADAYKNIVIRNFHAWLKVDLKISEERIPNIIEKLDRGEAILPKYDAILIDEGQDFEPEWLQLVSRMLNSETQSLLLVEDRAQDIYKRKRSYLKDTGLDFRGRSKILSINYRNTAQIVHFAWNFFQAQSQLQDKVVQGEIDGVEIIPPQSTRRKGLEPVIVKMDNFWKEIYFVVEQIRFLNQTKKVPLSEIAILYRVKRTNQLAIIDIIIRTFEKQKIPYYWISESEQSKRLFSRDDETVKISTIESIKGMDFQAVFVVNVDSMPFPLEEDKEREVSLLYIAITRAREYLYLTYSGESEFTRYLEEWQQKKRRPLHQHVEPLSTN